MHVNASSIVQIPKIGGGTETLLVVIVIGGGIVGASLAAMLSASSEKVRVVLVDPAKGHGISSTNQGRAHGGTWNPPADIKEAKKIIERNEQSQQLLDRLPNVWESNRYGLYCTASSLGATEFRKFLAAVGKDREFDLAPDAHMVKSWINPANFDCFRILEASFSPATLAGRLLRFAVSTGRCSLIEEYADKLEVHGSRFRVTLLNGETIEGDVVVNSLGGWHNSLRFKDLEVVQPKLVFNNWRLMALNSDSIGEHRLDRVITIDRSHTDPSRTEGPLAAIPHGKWIVFGKDLVATAMKSQDEVLPGEDWRAIDLRNRMDNELFEEHAEYFPVLKRLYDHHNMGALFSFPGVYPEVWSTQAAERSITGEPTPYRVQTSWIESKVPGYMSLFGGSATSALANAKDACEAILTKNNINTKDKEEWIERIAAGIPLEGEASMIWDSKRAPIIRIAA